MSKKKAVILGAGPAGISCAHRLFKEGYEVTVLERRDQVGGLGSTFQWENFFLDFGPHAFHPKPSIAMDNIKAIIRDDPDMLIYQDRNERLLLRNQLFQYPLKLWELVFRLNPLHTLRLVFDFVMASIIYKFIAVPDDNFESWGIKRFGKSLYTMCFGNYTGKVWGIPPGKISPNFARQKVHKLSLKDIVKKLLGGRGEEQENYWSDLFYPKKGSGQLFDQYQKFLAEKGVTFRLGCHVDRLITKDRIITGMETQNGSHKEIFDSDLVISSIPLPFLTRLLQDQLSEYANYKSTLLKFRSLILVYIEFLQEKTSDVHWIYLLDTQYQSNRFTEQKNMSTETCPPDRTVLCFERSCTFKDELWKASDEEVFQRIVNEDIQNNPVLDKSKIGRYHIIRIRHAYPIYDLGFERNLRVVLDCLSRFKNLYSIGRQGLFLQNDMHGSMRMGWEVGNFTQANNVKPPWDWYQTILKRWDMD